MIRIDFILEKRQLNNNHLYYLSSTTFLSSKTCFINSSEDIIMINNSVCTYWPQIQTNMFQGISASMFLLCLIIQLVVGLVTITILTLMSPVGLVTVRILSSLVFISLTANILMLTYHYPHYSFLGRKYLNFDASFFTVQFE